MVKPGEEGSSIGVSIVKTLDEFYIAVREAFLYGSSVIVEDYISGREFSVGILSGVPLPPIEIIPKGKFFDYQNKYQKNYTNEICPANLLAGQNAKIQTIALQVYRLLGLRAYSRVDFILDDKGDFYCLEANTLPGMTSESLLPKEAKAAGYSFAALCGEIVKQTVFEK